MLTCLKEPELQIRLFKKLRLFNLNELYQTLIKDPLKSD